MLDYGGKFLRLRKTLRNFHLPTSQDGKTAFSAIRKMATSSSGPPFSRPTPPT